MKCKIGRIAYSLLFVLSSSLTVCGQSQPCDQLHPDPGPYEYKVRGNRCEGLYIAKVGAESLDLISLTRGAIVYELGPGIVLKVSTKSQAVPVHVRAVGIPPRTYYRMDAILQSDATLDWPINDVLGPQNLNSDRIGIFAWKGESNARVFVPVQVTSSFSSQRPKGTTFLRVRPSIDTNSIRWRAAPVIAGDCSSFGAWKNAADDQVLAGQPVTLDLTSLHGQQCVQVIADSATTNAPVLLTIQVEI